MYKLSLVLVIINRRTLRPRSETVDSDHLVVFRDFRRGHHRRRHTPATAVLLSVKDYPFKIL